MNHNVLYKKRAAAGGVAAVFAGLAVATVCFNGVGRCARALHHPRPQSTAPKAIQWSTRFNEALAAAKKSGKPLLIDFSAAWCPACHLLDRDTYTDRSVIGEASNWSPVRVDTDVDPDLARKYAVTALPTVLLLRPDGEVIGRSEGFIEPAEMLSLLRGARAQ